MTRLRAGRLDGGPTGASALASADVPQPSNGVVADIGAPMAEAAVLGCVLRGRSPDAVRLLSQLTQDDWSVPVHAHVAAAATTLLQRGEPADPVTVLGQLRRQGTEAATTAAKDAGVLLIDLCQAAPALDAGHFYVRIVLEHSYRRRTQQAAVALLQACTSESIDGLRALVEREAASMTCSWLRVQALWRPPTTR